MGQCRRTSRPLAEQLLQRLACLERAVAAQSTILCAHLDASARSTQPAPGTWLPTSSASSSTLNPHSPEFVPTFGTPYFDELLVANDTTDEHIPKVNYYGFEHEPLDAELRPEHPLPQRRPEEQESPDAEAQADPLPLLCLPREQEPPDAELRPEHLLPPPRRPEEQESPDAEAQSDSRPLQHLPREHEPQDADPWPERVLPPQNEHIPEVYGAMRACVKEAGPAKRYSSELLASDPALMAARDLHALSLVGSFADLREDLVDSYVSGADGGWTMDGSAYQQQRRRYTAFVQISMSSLCANACCHARAVDSFDRSVKLACRLLRNHGFSGSSKIKEFLKFAIEAKVSSSTDEILELNMGLEALLNQALDELQV